MPELHVAELEDKSLVGGARDGDDRVREGAHARAREAGAAPRAFRGPVLTHLRGLSHHRTYTIDFIAAGLRA